jgi:hypothetical protein
MAALLLVPAGAGAAPPRFDVEPVSVGIERLDDLYATSGLESQTAVRLGVGGSLAVWGPLSVGVGAGMAAGSTDFGLLAGPVSRLSRRDVFAELRARAPGTLHGFGVQVAAGLGRLDLAYHPDRIEIPTQGGAIAVDLASVHAWTRHLAAEVLHSMPGGEVGLRGVWRFYSLDVASPAGVASQAARDLQLGVSLRVKVF